MHTQTLAVGVPCLIVLGLLIAATAWLIRNEGGPLLAIAMPFMVVVGIVCIIGVGSSVSKEINLQKRDAAIRHQLDQSGIIWVRLGQDDDHVVVESQGCRAELQIKKGANPGAWPLVSGTGKAISGCDGKNLDALFAPRP